MLADTLQALRDIEDQADEIITNANLKVREIEKQTYQQITKIENDTNAEIAVTLAELPQPKPLPEPIINLEVPQKNFDSAVAYIIQAVHGA
ncbi:MAG: hypothetical protein MJ054_01405 [Clostridia bacterium]|nr:hypothetical protein [Clostridia bacterium]